MRKVIAVIVAVIILLGLLYFFLGAGPSKKNASKHKTIKAGTVIGKSNSINTIYLLSTVGSEVDSIIHVNFLNGLKDKIENAIEGNSINISIISPDDLGKLLSKENVDFKGALLIIPEGDEVSKETLISIDGKSLTTIMYSSVDKKTCIGGNQSPYLWNFGITPTMYAESYLSYANQRYGKLAKELTFIIYSNQDPISEAEATYIENVMDGLGFEVQASVKVDSREDDLYPVLRDIFKFSPRILLTNANKRGIVPFIKQSHKLGFGFEMAMFLTEGIPEESIANLDRELDTFIKPSVFINSFESDSMKAFQKERESEGVLTPSFYRGYLVSEVIDRLLLQFKNNQEPINFSRALLGLDGNRIDAPSGPVMFHSKARGLIQPLHLGQYKDGHLNYLQYLGDMSPAEQCS